MRLNLCKTSDIPRLFQSTHPVRGATHYNLSQFGDNAFQSTHPVRGATSYRDVVRFVSRISIHAPREGCDFAIRFQRPCQTGISIHAPREGCDQECLGDSQSVAISIHAPREGCDHCFAAATVSARLFQSTHPVRGATSVGVGCRPPSTFQSTHPVRGATPPRA